MIQPEDVRRKAENLYRDVLRAWLDGDDAFFPRLIRANRDPDSNNLASAIQSVRRLRDGSKEVLEYGYTVQWQEINSRKLGRNRFPVRILFETRDDYLRFVGKQREFDAFVGAVSQLRTAFPELARWIRSNLRLLIDAAPDLDGLIHVLRYFRNHPRPNQFARELPLPVDTKFIERHQRLLREWFDIVLPPFAIRADEDHFERRYGIRYAEPHLLIRLLDPTLQTELGFPCAELSLPLHALGALPVREVSVFIVENKVNLLTLPALNRTIGLGALGDGVVLLRYVPWLRHFPVTYWGDLDVEGFVILSALRAIYPHTKSLLMDRTTIDRWQQLAVAGTGRRPDLPPHLTAAEKAAFEKCTNENLRIEQERLPHHEVLTVFADLRDGVRES